MVSSLSADKVGCTFPSLLKGALKQIANTLRAVWQEDPMLACFARVCFPAISVAPLKQFNRLEFKCCFKLFESTLVDFCSIQGDVTRIYI